MDFLKPLIILAKQDISHSYIVFHNRQLSHLNQSTNHGALKTFHLFPVLDNPMKSILMYKSLSTHAVPTGFPPGESEKNNGLSAF